LVNGSTSGGLAQSGDDEARRQQMMGGRGGPGGPGGGGGGVSAAQGLQNSVGLPPGMSASLTNDSLGLGGFGADAINGGFGVGAAAAGPGGPGGAGGRGGGPGARDGAVASGPVVERPVLVARVAALVAAEAAAVVVEAVAVVVAAALVDAARPDAAAGGLSTVNSPVSGTVGATRIPLSPVR